jgi:Kef-type K+ transport system membrane component KefB
VNDSLLLPQILLVVIMARVAGSLLQMFKQPAVIGEIAAGIVLGPLVLGALAPGFHEQLFGQTTLAGLKAISSLGLVLFMFTTGCELRPALRDRGMLLRASLIGVGSFVLPFGLGVLVGASAYAAFAPPGVPKATFVLFIAVSLAITALPVMTRILTDRNLLNEPVGQISLSAAAVSDLLSWSALLLVLTLGHHGGGWSMVRQWLLVALLCALAFLVVRPALARFADSNSRFSLPAAVRPSLVLIGLIAFSIASDRIGVHTAFGALLFGACIPTEDSVVTATVNQIKRLALLLFMPVFFAYSGLSTSGDLLSHGNLGMFAVILAAAISGKIVGALIGARLSGYDWRLSLSIGSLMNARGLMELVVIRIGLDLGIIGSSVFTMLLGMALLTTLTCAPLLSALRAQPSVEAELGYEPKPSIARTRI